MAKNDNLKDFLTDVADAIREKKGTTDLINPQDFSSEIASIQGGGDVWGFDKIGYTPKNNIIQKEIDYSAELLRKWNNGEITTFKNETKMVFCPNFDSSKIKSFSVLFNNCSSLIVFPHEIKTSHITNFEACWQSCTCLKSLNIDTSKATTTRAMCQNCQRLSEISPLDLSSARASSGNSTFHNCLDLKELIVYNTSGISKFSSFVYSCTSLERLSTLDLASTTDMQSPFYKCSALVYIQLVNLGKSTLTTYDFSGATIWGTGGEENRQSLIDSLITYSYDRASAGMPTATIKLSATTKALLTENEIAQITNKGFTIA